MSPSGSIKSKKAALASIVAEQHRLLKQLRDENVRINKNIQKIENSAISNFTPAQKADLNRLYDARIANDRMIVKYNLIKVLNLNSAEQVAALAVRVQAANDLLRDRLNKVNSVVQVVNNVNAILATAASLLGAVKALAAFA
jgi:hypothetical protein